MAKKVPRPRVKAKKMHWLDKLFMGIGGLSPLIKHPNLYRSLSGGSELGARRLAKLKAARIAKYGKWGARGVGGVSGLLNPWTAVPTALLLGAQHIVGNAMKPYMDPETLAGGSRENVGLFHSGTISKEGSARMLRERLAQEDLASRIKAAKEGGAGFWELARMRSNPDDFYQHPEYLKNAPGIKRDTQLSHLDFHGLNEKQGKWFNFNEGGIARLL